MSTNMRNFYLILLPWLLDVPTILAGSSPGYHVPTCDSTVIDKINTFWGGAGTPNNILKLMEDNGEFTVVMKSFRFLERENKCIHINVNAEQRKFSVLSTPIHDNHTTVIIDHHIEEGNGVLIDKKWEFDTYYISTENHVYFAYMCSPKEGEYGPMKGYISVATKYWNNSCTQTTLKTAQGLMELMGFNFTYKYGDECFN